MNTRWSCRSKLAGLYYSLRTKPCKYILIFFYELKGAAQLVQVMPAMTVESALVDVKLDSWDPDAKLHAMWNVKTCYIRIIFHQFIYPKILNNNLTHGEPNFLFKLNLFYFKSNLNVWKIDWITELYHFITL